jgi:hypothetical protein
MEYLLKAKVYRTNNFTKDNLEKPLLILVYFSTNNLRMKFQPLKPNQL